MGHARRHRRVPGDGRVGGWLIQLQGDQRGGSFARGELCRDGGQRGGRSRVALSVVVGRAQSAISRARQPRRRSALLRGRRVVSLRGKRNRTLMVWKTVGVESAEGLPTGDGADRVRVAVVEPVAEKDGVIPKARRVSSEAKFTRRVEGVCRRYLSQLTRGSNVDCLRPRAEKAPRGGSASAASRDVPSPFSGCRRASHEIVERNFVHRFATSRARLRLLERKPPRLGIATERFRRGRHDRSEDVRRHGSRPPLGSAAKACGCSLTFRARP